MKTLTKRVLALVLTLLIVFSCTIIGFAAQEKTPCILIPGFGQSETLVYDEDGTYLGDVSSFDLPNLDVNNIVKSVIFPALSSALLKQDIGLSKALKKEMETIFKPFLKNDDGSYKYKTVVREYNKAYAYLPSEDRAEINRNVSLSGFSDYDTVRYYFTYDSFGSIVTAAERLHNYLHNVVLSQTGADKVIFIPVSQGGTVFQMFLDMFPEDAKYIKKVVSMIPAYDGSVLVGDILTGNVNLTDISALHSDIIPSLLEDLDMAHGISIALRLLLSTSTQKKVVNAALDSAIDLLIKRSSSMWALCPADAYKTAKDTHLSNEKLSAVRAECEKYDTARANFKNNLQKLIDNGVIVHTIVSYDVGLMLAPLFGSNRMDADDLLVPSSPSLGSTAAPLGETLGDDYVSPNTYCSNPNHNHISPDKKIDASTGFLPENTWYFKSVTHTGMNGRNDVKNFCVSLITDDSITDVYSSSKYTQFTDPKDYISDANSYETDKYIYYYDASDNYMYAEHKANDEPKSENKFLTTIYKGLNTIFGAFDKAFHIG